MLKAVIASHVSYVKQLGTFLESLDYKNHRERIIVVVTGVEENGNEVGKKYADGTYFELTPENIITTAYNIDEYSSFVALGRVLREDPGFEKDTMFLMLHDTCEAGRLFWKRFQEIEENINDTTFRYDQATDTFTPRVPTPVYVLDDGMVMDTITSIFVNNGVLQAKTQSGADMFITDTIMPSRDPLRAMDVGAAKPADIEHALKSLYMWYPLTMNFNFGVARRIFLSHVVAPAYEGFFKDNAFTKELGIDIEVNISNPLCLLRLSMMKFRFVFQLHSDESIAAPPLLSYWVNDCDVYDNGIKRSIGYIPFLDLKKYTRIRGPLAERKWRHHSMNA